MLWPLFVLQTKKNGTLRDCRVFYFCPKVTTKCFMHNCILQYPTHTSPCVDLCSPSLFITPCTGSTLSGTGWPFQPCLCPRWILTPPVSLKLDFSFFFLFFFLSAQIGNGQDVKLALICCSRGLTQYQKHYIKRHFKFNERDKPLQRQLCRQAL